MSSKDLVPSPTISNRVPAIKSHRIMKTVIAFLAGLVGAVAGFFAGLGVGTLLVDIFNISSFEGQSGYFVIFTAGLGCIIGFFAAVVLTLIFHGRFHRIGAVFGRVGMIVIALAAIVAIGIQVRLATHEHFPGLNPRMQIEIRLPEGAAVPSRKLIDLEIHAGSQRGGAQLNDNWIRHDGNHPVLSGFAELYTRTTQRMLVVSLPDTPKLLFSIKLAATPRSTKSFGDWQRVDYVDDGKADTQPRKPNKNELYEIRYYVPE